MTKLQQVNKIVIKMLNKQENQRKESRNVAIDRKFTKKYSKHEQLMNKTLKVHRKYDENKNETNNQ